MDSDSIAAAAEEAKPSHGSNDGEAPPADNGQDDPSTHSHPPEATAKTNNNEETKENTGQSETVSAGQSATAVEGPRPSHDSNNEDTAPSPDDGQHDLDTHIHQPDAAGGAPVTTYDRATEETTTQSDSPSRNQNVVGTESARDGLSADPGGGLEEVEETAIENKPINNGSPTQLERGLPSQSDAELGTNQNQEPDPESGPEPAPESVSGPNPEEMRDTYPVRLAEMSPKNIKPRELELNQALGQAIVDGKLETFNHLLEQGANILSRFDDNKDDGYLNQSTLFLAARYDRTKVAEKCLESKLAKDFLEDNKTNGWTPAHIAAQNKSIKVLGQIIKAGKSIGIHQNIVNSRNEDNETPLFLAARENHLHIVKALLKGGADIKIESIEGTPLHAAAYYGSKKVFGYLLRVPGVKDLIGKQDEDGWTVLHCAAFGGIKVDPKLYNNSILGLLTKRTQATPLHIAALNGYKDIVISFLAAGSDILAKTNSGKTVFHMGAESGDIEILKELAGRLDRDTLVLRDDKGGTALCSAAEQEEYDAVFFLMSHWRFTLPRLELGASAKVNYRDTQKVEDFLIKVLNEPKSKVDSLAHWHLIVHWAVFYGWESIATKCFERRKELCALKTKSGETLLHVAACNGHAGVVKQLMEHLKKHDSAKKPNMAEVIGKKNDKIIPLHFAASNGHLQIMIYLLGSSVSSQFDVESRDEIIMESRYGETALYFAAKFGHKNVVSAILLWLDKYPQLQSTIRKKTSDGKTPLSQATENGHQGVAKALLEVLTKHDFKNDPKAAWDELTEVARTGLEHYVKLIAAKAVLLPSQPETNPEKLFSGQKWTGLLWVVYYGHYEAFWWLLRRNGPPMLTPKIVKDAAYIIKMVRGKAPLTETSGGEKQYDAIEDCLESPPGVEKVYDQFNPEGSPSVPRPSPKKKEVCDDYKATIVDFYDKADHVSFAALKRTISVTIYDEGRSLDEIMTNAGMDLREPKSLNGVVAQATSDALGPAAGTQRSPVTTRQEQGSTQKQVRDDKYRFRWIHVPANNVRKTPIPGR